MTGVHLPQYPSARAKASLPPSQLATLNQLISSSLQQCLTLENLDKDSAITFISSYAKETAAQRLHALIWEDPTSTKSSSKRSKVESVIHFRVLLLAERLSGLLGFQTLLDLCVAYGESHPKRMRSIFASAFTQNTPSLKNQIQSDAVPAFTTLLNSTAQGLYGIRKLTYILLCCCRLAPVEIRLMFSRDKFFVLALAKAYDQGLAAIAHSYGGLRIRDTSPGTQLEEWEQIWLDTKVSLLDTFHILIRTLLESVAEVSTAGHELAVRSEPAFEVIFALLELPPSPSGSGSNTPATPTPFLNQSLLADYQHAYDFSKILVSTLRKADNERTQLLEHALQSLDQSTDSHDPGVLKLILRSSGIPPGIDYYGKGPSRSVAVDKGKGKAVDKEPAREDDPQLDAAVSQVLDILPEYSPEYLRYLLAHPDYPYKGDAERLIGALLEGTAPSVEEVDAAMAREASDSALAAQPPSAMVDEFQYTKDRRNVFDDKQMDLSQVRIGKKAEIEQTVIQDRSFIEQMKADILRRAEAALNEDSEDEDDQTGGGKEKGIDVAFEDELDDGGNIRVRDGEPTDDQGESTDEGDDGEDEGTSATKRAETILELAYLKDPKLFDRDAQTRRSKARADLKAQTGWDDGQIEGWKIMLERNPKKDKILQKHEFTGNKPLAPSPEPSSSSSHQGEQRGGRGRGRGRGRGGSSGGGRGRGRGGGGGGGNGGGGGEGSSARDRAWKDKNKARQGNHNRKAGHDKKMARAAPPPT